MGFSKIRASRDNIMEKQVREKGRRWAKMKKSFAIMDRKSLKLIWK
jgi:hypothetical protein